MGEVLKAEARRLSSPPGRRMLPERLREPSNPSPHPVCVCRGRWRGKVRRRESFTQVVGVHVAELGCDSVVTHSVGIGCALETASVGGIWSLGVDKVPQM